MANNKKKQQGSQHHHPQASLEENKERVNAQIEKLQQGSIESLMDAQAEFQRTVLDELRQIRFGLQLKFPVFRFDDVDHHPLDWLSRAERFFNFYKVPEDQKFAMASNHFEGRDALEWLILYERSRVPSSSWTHFVEQFLTRFGYVDIDGSLLRLKQQGGGKEGVDAYITDFIRLVSRASKNWSDNQLKGFFVNGLQDKLRGDIRLYKPETLSEAIEIARVLERPPQKAVPETFIPGLPRYQALFMGKTRVKVLITSSTHNVISPSVLDEADRRLIIKEDDPLVMEPLAGPAFGNQTTTEGRIDGAQVNLQGFKFAADFYLFPNLAGCDLMLGNGWRSTLGTYTFGQGWESFTVNGRNYQITAEKHPPGTITQPCMMSLKGTRKGGRA